MSMSMALLDPAPSSAPRSTSSRTTMIVALVIFFSHVPLLFLHFQQLWLKPHYQLYPLVLIGAFVLLWPLKHFSRNSAPGGMKYAFTCEFAGVSVVLVGMLIDSVTELSFLGSPGNWVAAGGLALFAAIPLTIFTGLGSVYAGSDSSSRGMAGAFATWFLLAISVFFLSPSGAAASMIGLSMCLAYTAGGWPLLRRCLPALLYLFLIVPPPFMWDTRFVIFLQWLASRVSSKILDQFGVYHFLSGVVIQVGDQRYMVEDACSGISSLLSTLACVLFYVIYFRLHWLRATLLVMLSLVWVMVNNSLRIIGITFFGSRLGIDISRGVPHFLFGILLFALTLLLIWSSDRLLMFFGRSDPTQRRYDPINVSQETARNGMANLLELNKAFYRSIPLAAVFGVLLAMQIAEQVAVARIAPYSGSALSKLYANLNVNLLPESIGPWKRPDKVIPTKRDSGAPLGEYSQIWQYAQRPGSAVCSVSLDYPYPEFHDLRICYKNVGWNIGETSKFRHPTTDGRPDLICVSTKLSMPGEKYAYLWFCEFDQDGAGVDPVTLGPLTDETANQRMLSRFTYAGARWQRIFMPSKTAASSGFGSVLQVQLLMGSNQTKSEEELAPLKELFTKSAEALRAKCVELKNAR